MARVQLDKVRADDGGGDGVKNREHLARSKAARLTMGNAGSKRGVERVEVERDIDRRFKPERRRTGPMSSLVDLHAKPVGLLPLVRVHAAYPDLHQPRGERFLHDPREGAGMGKPVAFERVVEVGMGVEVQDLSLIHI